MRRHVNAWARPVALVVVTGVAFPAMPAAAAPAPKPAASAPLAAAIARAAAAAPSTALAQDPAPATADTPGGFFSTPKGKIAVALFVGGVAWTIYSVKDSRDPVKSPIR